MSYRNRKTTRSNRFQNRTLTVESMESRALMAVLIGAPIAAPPTNVGATVSAMEAPGSFGQGISATQQQNLMKLKTDLLAIRAGSQVTPTQIEQLITDVVVLVQGTVRPSSESVAKLRTDLQTSLSDGVLTVREKALLTGDVKAILVSANVPKSEIDAVISDVQAIIESSGISKSDLQTLQSDIQAIKQEFRNQHPKA